MRTFAGQGGTPTLPYAPALVRPGCLCESLVTSDELHGYGLLVLSARDVYMSYGKTPALRGAFMEVGEGEIVALVGPSGSGKSTLLQCLAGICVPDRGEVHFDGQMVSALSDAQRTDLRRRFFGFVMQFGHLVPDMSIAENVALPLMLRGVGRREAMRAAGLELEGLGLGAESARRPGEVSGGQQQRAAVARALAGSPRVIFADEPTGSLDSANGDVVIGLLTERAREAGTSVVIVTHDEARLDAVDRVVMLRDGVQQHSRQVLV